MDLCCTVVKEYGGYGWKVLGEWRMDVSGGEGGGGGTVDGMAGMSLIFSRLVLFTVCLGFMYNDIGGIGYLERQIRYTFRYA